MSNLLSLTSTQLKRAASIKDEITDLEKELTSILGGTVSKASKPTKKRKMSNSARAKIAVAQKARWAKFHAGKSK